jgi:hypothetical protein
MTTKKTLPLTLDKVRRNRMGTITFEGQFDGMRKPQEFIVYPLHAGDEAKRLKIQSDTRIGFVHLADGEVVLSPPSPSGAHNRHLVQSRPAGRLSGEALLNLKTHVMASASGHAGTSVVYTDNSAALEVFTHG